jgi:transposase
MIVFILLYSPDPIRFAWKEVKHLVSIKLIAPELHLNVVVKNISE